MNLQLSSGPVAVAVRSAIHLPYVAGGRVNKVQAIFDLMRDHPEQGRKELVWDNRLMWLTHHRCETQADEGWTGHVDPDGEGPNFWLRVLGYRLPSWYSQADGANNIESLAHGGSGSVEQVWAAWMNSEPHRIHILGLNDFYAAQVCVGIGYYHLESSEYNHYWSIITAPGES